MGKVIIVGCGYVGDYLANRYVNLARSVVALRRSDIGKKDYDVKLYDLDSGALPEAIDWSGAEVFYLAPPQDTGERDERARRFVQQIKDKGIRKLVYMSTTGVYGDCKGDWVDERAELKGQSDRSKRRMDAEQAFSKLEYVELVILRVAGIYGPGRLPVDRVKQGMPITKVNESPWSNRIHVEDLVEVCVKSMEQGRGIYNVSDGVPQKMSMLYINLAEILGVDKPVELPKDAMLSKASPMMREFLSESKRVLSKRIIEELGVKLKYSDWASGLRASL